MIQEAVEILLVEDNEYDAELALRSFKKNNISNKITWLKDGAEALDFLFKEGNYEGQSKRNMPKIIFLDLMLPKINGLEVLEQIKAREETSNIPVVMLTSSKEEQDLYDSYSLGVNSYIVKPLEFDNFSKTIANIGYYWMILNQNP